MSGIASRFPVVIPAGFTPSDGDADGTDLRWDGKPCPCQTAPYRPAFGGGFRAKRGRHDHRALDIMAPEGAHVVAPCDGVIPLGVRMTLDGKPGPHPGAGTGIKAGHYVCVVDAQGWRWYLAHLRDAPLVQPGETVVAGQLLGYVGRSGNASRDTRSGIRGCPHLHISLNGTRALLAKARREGIDVAGGKADCVPVLRPLWEAGGWQG